MLFKLNFCIKCNKCSDLMVGILAMHFRGSGFNPYLFWKVMKNYFFCSIDENGDDHHAKKIIELNCF